MTSPIGCSEVYNFDLPVWAGWALATNDWSELTQEQVDILKRFVEKTVSFFCGTNDYFFTVESERCGILELKDHDLSEFEPEEKYSNCWEVLLTIE
jgi:hypothetical protein